MEQTSKTRTTFGKPGNCVVSDITRPSADVVAQFKGLPSSAIGDVMDRRSVMDAGIQPLDRKMRLCGPALTVEVRPGDNLMIHAALKVSSPGDILVIDGHRFDQAAVFGMLMTHTAIAIRLGGIVIDGAIRDAEEIIASGFAAYSRYVCPAGPHKTGPGQVNMPISCGGVPVAPGDVIVGDGDGIVVVPQDNAEAMAAAAHKKIAAEEKREREINEEGKHHQSWLIPNLRAAGVLGPEETL